MGISDTGLILDLIQRVRYWISWVGRNSIFSYSMCCECKTMDFNECQCESCGHVLCGKCAEEHVKLCKFCVQDDVRGDYGVRIAASLPRISPESQLVLNDDNIKQFQSHHLSRFLEVQRYGCSSSSSVTSSTGHPSPGYFRHSSSRSDEEDGEDSGKHFFSPSSEYCRDISDVDSSSISARHDFYSFKSMSSSPLDSPSRSQTPTRVDFSVQQDQQGSPASHNDLPHQETMAVLRRPGRETEDLETTGYGCDDLSIFRDQCEEVQHPLDFENNGLIWFPPPPEDEGDEMENNFFESDDEDGDVGELGMTFSSNSFSTNAVPYRDKPSDEHKEPLRAAVRGHFRALVSQLLQGEGVSAGNESGTEGWLDIVTSVAWQAANFVKPDTRRGGSMDPGHYVKVKCIVSGTPSESTLIKGVVCTKNIKHKRMTSQYKNPRLLILGGALEYQRTPNQLASFDTLLQQEMDHLKMVVAKIEAHRPNVLLVEKSVASYAQEYLLAKEISLVLNVKRPLLERIARCTGANIVPSIGNLSMTRLGHCEIFRLERVFEDQPNKRSAKTLMFFEGCPRRLGCTVLLKGASREVLKKVKHVVQYAVFAAYHLSLETCFLADEGASLPEIPLKPTVSIPKRHINTDDTVPQIPNAVLPSDFLPVAVQRQDSCQCTTSRNSCFHLTSDVSVSNDDAASSVIPSFRRESSPWDLDPGYATATSGFSETAVGRAIDASSGLEVQRKNFSACPSEHELLEASLKEDKTRGSRNHGEIAEDHTVSTSDRIGGNEVSTELFSSVENHQSILVSFSSRCVLKGTICERSQLLRIKFYGCFDKPLGRYLQEDLFNQTSHCLSCKEATDAHVRCYTHQQGSLTINVRRLSSVELPGERDGKMWMWHRCLKCAHINGVPPATRRVIMSDAAWGLSFGKFLELSFSNHATANRVANCGHSLQRDCLRYYGFGGMVAFFRYSPIDILSVRLPPSMLQFNGHFQQEWVNREATEVSNKMEVLYAEVGDALHNIERKGSSLKAKQSDESEFHSHIMDLKILLKTERNEYENLLRPVAIENSHYLETTVDILELNRLRRCLLIDSYIWDHRLYSLDSLLKTNSLISKVDSHILEAATYTKLKEWRDNSLYEDGKLGHASGKSKMNSRGVSENTKDHLTSKEIGPNSPHFVAVLNELPAINSADRACFRDMESTSIHAFKCDELSQNEEIPVDDAFLESIPSPASNLSDKIDSAWTGTCQQPLVSQVNHVTQPNGYKTTPFGLTNQKDNPVSSRLRSPMRVYSFDSALRMQEKIRRRSVPTYLQLSSLRSFPSGDYRSMVRDPISDTTLRSFSVTMLKETQKLNSIFSSMPLFIPSASHIGEGIQLPLSQTNFSSMVIPIYDNEPTSIIAYVLGSNEYHNWIAQKFEDHEGGWSGSDSNREDGVSVLSNYYHSASSTFSAWQSHGSLDLEDGIFRHGSEDASATGGGLFSDSKTSHFRVSFGDASSSFAGKVKFSVVCYFARQFDALRQKCCPSEVNFISSVSRCSRWNAQGGKSNVYFARSFDERFIVKQVTKTELDSFEEFAPEYFKYLTDSLSTGSPTCLAKVLGIYQVTVKHLKGGRESRMDLMVMENLFFGRGISRVYDLKGSARSRYNPDTTGKNKVLLDTNLLETLRTNPIFLSGKAKRSLERAVWNDTSFLAFVDVMDYSLLVGVDEERKELVLGIIDFMRQYTWDKHLETWVKASGILGGPRNASPTVISPVQYKKRFRKAMSTYFLTVPDQWSQ